MFAPLLDIKAFAESAHPRQRFDPVHLSGQVHWRLFIIVEDARVHLSAETSSFINSYRFHSFLLTNTHFNNKVHLRTQKYRITYDLSKKSIASKESFSTATCKGVLPRPSRTFKSIENIVY